MVWGWLGGDAKMCPQLPLRPIRINPLEARPGAIGTFEA